MMSSRSAKTHKQTNKALKNRNGSFEKGKCQTKWQEVLVIDQWKDV